MKLGSVPVTIMVVALVVVAALLYFLTREGPQDSDVVAPPVGTESVEPPPADDDSAVRIEPQGPSGTSETADPEAAPPDGETAADEVAEREGTDESEGPAQTGDAGQKEGPETADPKAAPSDGEMAADEVAEREGTDESEGTAPTGGAGQKEEPETADPEAAPSDGEMAADEVAGREGTDESEGTAPTGDAGQKEEPETADPEAAPSDGEMDADEVAGREGTDESEGTAPTGGADPKEEPETADPEAAPSGGEMDADEVAEREGTDESEGPAPTGDAASIELGSMEDTTEATPDPAPAADQPAEGVADLGEPASSPDASVQPADTAGPADGLAPGDGTPPDSEIEPCEGMQPLTDDAAAGGTIPCPDETDATAGERDTVPETKAPTDGPATDGASGEGTEDEVTEDALEAPEPADEAGESATEPLPDVQDAVPEDQAPADGLAPGDGTPPDSEIEPCEGMQPLTDDAAAGGTIPCPDETDATAGERDTVPETKAPTDGPATDGASGEGTEDEVTEDALEAPEPADEAGESATEPLPDVQDAVPEDQVPSDGPATDGATGEGTEEEVTEDALEAPGPADEAGESTTEPLPDVQDAVPEDQAPADGQATDGAPGEGTEDEVTGDALEAPGPADEAGESATEPLPDVQDADPEDQAPADGQATDGAPGEGTEEEVTEDASEAPGPADEAGETTAGPLPEIQDAVPGAEGLEPVEQPATMDDAACPEGQAEVPQGEVGTDGRGSCPDEISKAGQSGLESELRHDAPTEQDSGPEMATEVPEEFAVEDDDATAPAEPATEADVGPKPDGTADAVAPEGKDEVGTRVADQSEGGDETAVGDDGLQVPADGASGPSQDPNRKEEPASDQPGESVAPTEGGDGPVGDDGSASGLPGQEQESMPDSRESVDLEAEDKAPAASTAEVVEDAAIEGESAVAESAREDLTPPSFDLVRVDRFGTTVLAGRAPVDSLVEALVDGEVASSQAAGRIGQFAMIFSVDTQRDTLAIGLRATLPDGRSVDSDSSVFVVVPHGRMVPINPVAEDGTGIESIAPVELPTTKLADLEELQPSVLLATNEGVRLIQPSVPDDEGKLLVEIVSYDEEGEVFIAGSTRSDEGRISIFLDGELVKSTEISPGGSWWTDLKGVEPGRYRLRVEEIDQSGTVVASVEMPFQKEAPEHAREMLTTASRSRDVDATGSEQGPIISLLAVQRGFTLWGISRKQYGLGRLYVNIFEANRDQINNPHLIYPGQIFILPHESQLVDPLW